MGKTESSVDVVKTENGGHSSGEHSHHHHHHHRHHRHHRSGSRLFLGVHKRTWFLSIIFAAMLITLLVLAYLAD